MNRFAHKSFRTISLDDVCDFLLLYEPRPVNDYIYHLIWFSARDAAYSMKVWNETTDIFSIQKIL